MKRKLINTLSMITLAATMFTMATGFTMAPEASEPHVCISCAAATHECGRYRESFKQEWSDRYFVGTGAARIYERKRLCGERCPVCGTIFWSTTYYEYQRRLYAGHIIPLTAWQDV